MLYQQLKFRLLGFCLLVILFGSCDSERTFLYPNKRVIKLGDNPAWASKDWNDSNWNKAGTTDSLSVFWVRFDINFDERIHDLKHKGIQLISIGSYEAFWDGQLVHENGKVANNKTQEIPGQFISHILLPDSLCNEGNHVLSLRLSNHHLSFIRGTWNIFHIEEYLSSRKHNFQLTVLMYLFGGIYLIAAIYYLFIYMLQRKDQSHFLFGLMCLLFFGLISAEYIKFVFEYPYHYHYWRLSLISILTISISFIVPYFLYTLFDIPKKRIFTILYSVVLILYLSLNNIINDDTMQTLSVIMITVSLGIGIFALYLKRKGNVIVLTALIISSLLSSFSNYGINHLLFNYDINLFIGFSLLVLSILYLMIQKSKEQQVAYETSLLQSERLKNELLKKNIQPHFLMNTLTSIMEWIEVSPKKSIHFIEALAGELEILNEIAEQKLIPISQEIELCQQHLKIMSYRKDIDYIWNDSNIDPSEKIPPAIFHTILENGITHSKPLEGGKIHFHLTYDNNGKEKKYVMTTHAINRKTQKDIQKGTGTKYIESRLNESYIGKWEYISQEDTNGWKTTIKILD